MTNFKRCDRCNKDISMDSDNQLMGDGIFMPEIDTVDFCDNCAKIVKKSLLSIINSGGKKQ